MKSRACADQGLIGGIVSLACVLSVAESGLAVPYASGVQRDGNTVSFTLNEPADTVTITRDGGNAVALTSASSGEHTFDMTGYNSYMIGVTHSAPAGWAESSISVGNPMLKFERANGIAVNQNPGSPYFGRFYVSQRDDTVTWTGRQMGDGIYVFNADATDAFGITDANDTNAARTGGIDFTGSSHSPFRLTIGKDDTLYIGDASDVHGGMYYTDADVTTGGNLLAGSGGTAPITGQNHGSIMNTPVVTGSLYEGDLVLYTIDQDLEASVPGTGSHIWRYDLGGAHNFSGAPTLMIDASLSPYLSDTNGGFDTDGSYVVDADIARDPRTGNFLIIQRNAVPIIMSPDFSTVLGDLQIQNYRSAAYSPDGKNLALRNSMGTYILSLDAQGLPISTSPFEVERFRSPYGIEGGSISMRVPITYDLAGNIYTAGNQGGNGERLGIYSPGGDSAAITRSDGTFTINGTTYGEDYLPGDLDSDGFVGLNDLDLLLAHWNQSVPHGELLQADPTGDGFVGLDDLDLVLGNWNTGTPPGSQASIPEPGSMICLILTGMGCLGRRRG